jgi:hypothetical protein
VPLRVHLAHVHHLYLQQGASTQASGNTSKHNTRVSTRFIASNTQSGQTNRETERQREKERERGGTVYLLWRATFLLLNALAVVLRQARHVTQHVLRALLVLFEFLITRLGW